MDEQTWLNCTDPQGMLELLEDSGKAGKRKLILFKVACCRPIRQSKAFSYPYIHMGTTSSYSGGCQRRVGSPWTTGREEKGMSTNTRWLVGAWMATLACFVIHPPRCGA